MDNGVARKSEDQGQKPGVQKSAIYNPFFVITLSKFS
jgi:hypothetical protein